MSDKARVDVVMTFVTSVVVVFIAGVLIGSWASHDLRVNVSVILAISVLLVTNIGCVAWLKGRESLNAPAGSEGTPQSKGNK